MKDYINIGNFILEILKIDRNYNSIEDILIGGSVINGFFDNYSDIDIFLVVNDDEYDYWTQSKYFNNLQKNMKIDYNIDLNVQRKDAVTKIKHMIKSYSIRDKKYTNDIDMILPVIAPINKDRYSIRIKPRKWLKFKKAYENGDMWFYDKKLEDEWLEKLERDEWKYKKYLLRS